MSVDLFEWEKAQQRAAEYPIYGGRGIKVCERWRGSFDNFLTDSGQRPSPQHSIERINNSGNYEPGNCYWATGSEQCENRRGYGETGFKGVWHDKSGRYRSQIIRGGKRFHLGMFDTAEAAHAEYAKVAKEWNEKVELSHVDDLPIREAA